MDCNNAQELAVVVVVDADMDVGSLKAVVILVCTYLLYRCLVLHSLPPQARRITPCHDAQGMVW